MPWSWHRNKKYYVSFEEDDRVTPEETLLDSNSRYSDIEKPIPGSIFSLFLAIFLIATGLLAILTFKISVIDHEEFAKLAFQNKSANFSLPPPRGIITDRNGQPLVKNIPVFNLLAVTRELKENKADMDGSAGKIAEILGQEPDKFLQNIKAQMKASSTFMAYLDLSKDQAVRIKYLEPKGFYVISETKREYPDGSKISQILGYTGRVSKEDLDADSSYLITDTIGRLGIENSYEKYLRGKHGNIFFSKSEDEYSVKNPEPGQNIVLNIDRDLQIKLYDEIATVLKEAGLSRGAGIIQNPKTGAVLALASFPSFDNNVFISGLSGNDYKYLFENRLKPLLNRVIGGLYNPGSTIKPLIGMAALEEKIISLNDTINDCISLTVSNPYNPSDTYTFNNWRTEYGRFDLKRSIANSCNVFFFTIGGGHEKIKGLGVEKIARYLKNSLADLALGIDLPGEENGFVPTPEWKARERGDQWYLGDTYNISIGQGDLLVTPLWLNSYISGIAAGGTLYKPKVAKGIMKNNEVGQNFEPEIIGSLPFSKEVIDEMKIAMKEVVNSGTAQIFKELPVSVAAKTGTAEVQKGKTVNSLLAVFGPYDDPDFTMTILIEGATNQQGLAIKAAHNVLKWKFESN